MAAGAKDHREAALGKKCRRFPADSTRCSCHRNATAFSKGVRRGHQSCQRIASICTLAKSAQEAFALPIQLERQSFRRRKSSGYHWRQSSRKRKHEDAQEHVG
mmetsp:Transcript_12503/g.27047  ORF Transcript_12503/g.27047 Transcript_12503/m.27047 type:complete len:103 (-) Transcript_12503:70-378(-)